MGAERPLSKKNLSQTLQLLGEGTPAAEALNQKLVLSPEKSAIAGADRASKLLTSRSPMRSLLGAVSLAEVVQPYSLARARQLLDRVRVVTRSGVGEAAILNKTVSVSLAHNYYLESKVTNSKLTGLDARGAVRAIERCFSDLCSRIEKGALARARPGERLRVGEREIEGAASAQRIIAVNAPLLAELCREISPGPTITKIIWRSASLLNSPPAGLLPVSGQEQNECSMGWKLASLLTEKFGYAFPRPISYSDAFAYISTMTHGHLDLAKIAMAKSEYAAAEGLLSDWRHWSREWGIGVFVPNGFLGRAAVLRLSNLCFYATERFRREDAGPADDLNKAESDREKRLLWTLSREAASFIRETLTDIETIPGFSAREEAKAKAETLRGAFPEIFQRLDRYFYKK